MPNHLHVVIAFTNKGKSVNRYVSTMKRIFSYELIRRLKQQQQLQILSLLEEGVTPADKMKGKLHKVFEPSFDAKLLYSDVYIVQKLEYMHQNPCSEKWQLAVNTLQYPHSSAFFYYTGEQGIYPVLTYRELADMNLHALMKGN